MVGVRVQGPRVIAGELPEEVERLGQEARRQGDRGEQLGQAATHVSVGELAGEQVVGG